MNSAFSRARIGHSNSGYPLDIHDSHFQPSFDQIKKCLARYQLVWYSTKTIIQLTVPE